MAKGWKKSERKKAMWWPAAVSYLKEASEPKSINNIIGNAKTMRHEIMTRGVRSRDYLLCRSRICPTVNQMSQYFRVKGVPYIQPKKGGRLYYWGDDVEE